MQTGWRLERTYLAGAGFPESRLEGLDIVWSDPLETTGHAALWADNGAGKTTITALRFALYLPAAREFIRGGSDRSLAKLVYSDNVCHVVEQATRVVDGELQRIVVGMVADWADGGTRDLENPSRLTRTFYGWVAGDDGPTIRDLPFRTTVGRWAARTQFLDAVRQLLPAGGALPPHVPSEQQARWQAWLATAGVDVEQIRFQAAMNASEGGVDRVMRFSDSDEFVRWLIGATTPTSTVEQIANSIDVLRANAAARPRWSNELALWERIVEPMLQLAIAHEQVAGDRRAAATAEADAAAVVAEAEATICALRAEATRAATEHKKHEAARRDAAATLRRTQAHRLRMQLRAAELRAEAAHEHARVKRAACEKAARSLAAWQLVEHVIAAAAAQSHLAGLEERLAAAEKETDALRADERRHRLELARLLTRRRDVADGEFRVAKRRVGEADTELEALNTEEQRVRAEHATTVERVRQLTEQVTAADQVITDAVASGLVGEGDEPEALDRSLEAQVVGARHTRKEADDAIEKIAELRAGEEQKRADAERRAGIARDDAAAAQLQLRQVTRRVKVLIQDPRLLDVTGNPALDVWVDRIGVDDALRQYAARADADAAEARSDIARARRTIDAVGTDGFLPPARIAEEISARCQAEEIPAWPGWRWLANTMNAHAAEAFATARPEIASGIVVSHPDFLHRAVEAAGGINLDVAVWIGAVTDPAAAMSRRHVTPEDGTHATVLMPHPGMYDQDAAADMIADASARLEAATGREQMANRRADDTRAMLATLEQLWSDLPDDPRAELGEKARAAKERQDEASADVDASITRLRSLDNQEREHRRTRDSAQEFIDDASETRRLLVAVIGAVRSRTTAIKKLPSTRLAAAEAKRRLEEIERRTPVVTAEREVAAEQARIEKRARDDAAEALRASRLSPIADGPVSTDSEATIRARLTSVQEAIAHAAVDPQLHEDIERARQHVSDLYAKLGTDAELRRLAENLAASDGARHPVALVESTRQAANAEARAREEYASARTAADIAKSDHQRRVEDHTSDRSSPDADGYPSADHVISPDDADRFAQALDELSSQLLGVQRSEERLATEAKTKADSAGQSATLVEASVRPMRHLAAVELSSRPATDVDELTRRIADVEQRVRETGTAFTSSRQREQQALNGVRGHANGPHARKVEEADDPRVADVLMRLRADEQVSAEADRLAEHLEQRATSLRDDLERHDQDVRRCAKMLHVQAATAIQRLRSYQNQSRLPDGLGDWSQRHFVVIDHEPMPSDDSVGVDRVARVVHSLLTPGPGKSDAQSLLFAAARALIDAPFRVRLLKPHTDLSYDRVDVLELKNFSGGQRVTAGVLLYATMTRVRAGSDATSIGWLWLDNPFGQASADQFVRTMRRAADQLGLQLLFTAAPKDMGALSMFDRTITLARKLRPSSGEKVAVVEDGSRQIVDLTLVQRDVLAVLGE